MWSLGIRSASLRGIAGNCPLLKPTTAAVAGIPSGVYGELHQVGKPSLLVGPCRLTARQSAKLIQIHWVRTLRSQVRVEKEPVGELILCVVVNVLRHVPIKVLKGKGVRRIPPGRQSRQFVVRLAIGLGLRSSQFGVL